MSNFVTEVWNLIPGPGQPLAVLAIAIGLMVIGQLLKRKANRRQAEIDAKEKAAKAWEDRRT